MSQNQNQFSDGHATSKSIDFTKSDINILLLGETGVGKSTFINSFANYVQHDTFKVAVNSDLLCLIPTKFTIPDEDFNERIVSIGFDKNEDQKIGNSSTRGTKSYVFMLDGDGRKIRFIDTPGIGDARGITQDNINFENVLDHISQYDYLHAICFLLKPNVSIITAYFKFCLLHLLSRLEKSAVQNIIFVFTNTRSTLYRPSETLTILKTIFKEIETNPPNVKIPLSAKNMFCMDNEAFRFLVALKNGVEFTEDDAEVFSSSWKISAKTCKNVLDYLTGPNIMPHLVKNTLSVNEARRVIRDLSKPLVDISELIQENLILLSRHEKAIARDGQSIEEFQSYLYVPVIHIVKKDLKYPSTVCTSATCSDRIPMDDLIMYHYKQRCHSPCSLVNVPKEHIGSIELLHCVAMGGTQSCVECLCPFGSHMHIYYETGKEAAKEENQSVKAKINSVKEQIIKQKEYAEKLQNKKAELEAERATITKSLAKFAYFLKNHSIAIFNDAHEDYLDYLITRENSLGRNSNQIFIDCHVELKKQYREEKLVLEKLFREENEATVTANEVQDLVSELYALKHTGQKISELHSAQQNMIFKEHESNTEYHHPKPISK